MKICFSNSDLKTKWMTPAMEQIAQLRKKTSVPALAVPKTSPRVTRSRVAQLKRKIILLIIEMYYNTNIAFNIKRFFVFLNKL